ncbi:hypothetical protein GCG54_00015416 [Colletotrichum gloeosporioides]|uniref:Uncharacterized protein n=1 Tax=Colletotrichum gloeosporioides TaxID=474922 RepID=A0A8H4CKZ9_COLGL|nr:uncharacterized protein GCG54_00015416 [Colletotrichum gloeosporioides]KAF3805855.1 hypothetical protein GCG54_00015416 [Colletotrichum gloeosporioides]
MSRASFPQLCAVWPLEHQSTAASNLQRGGLFDSNNLDLDQLIIEPKAETSGALDAIYKVGTVNSAPQKLRTPNPQRPEDATQRTRTEMPSARIRPVLSPSTLWKILRSEVIPINHLAAAGDSQRCVSVSLWQQFPSR